MLVSSLPIVLGLALGIGPRLVIIVSINCVLEATAVGVVVLVVVTVVVLDVAGADEVFGPDGGRGGPRLLCWVRRFRGG